MQNKALLEKKITLFIHLTIIITQFQILGDEQHRPRDASIQKSNLIHAKEKKGTGRSKII